MGFFFEGRIGRSKVRVATRVINAVCILSFSPTAYYILERFRFVGPNPSLVRLQARCQFVFTSEVIVVQLSTFTNY